ncbi:MAG: sucrose phosphorylase [bacterium]|nr:sucrose phosphorylase [bacterium]MCP4965738.1 sucrose phosphorylase [bacterium]
MTDRNSLSGVMLNAYPDSIGGTLSDILGVLTRPAFEDVFSLLYVLPTFFNSDLDRGFSVIDYNLNQELVSPADLARAKELNLGFKFDLVLNHLSVNSPQFQDLLENGDGSDFKDFFIDWNEFWEGEGQLGPEGFIIPNQEHLDLLYLRKPGLPILMVPSPDGSVRPYWNTFYQDVRETADGKRRYLGQMDLNAQSEKVWDFYTETFGKLDDYGAKVVRLDAFAYLHKQVGLPNFFNNPGTWEYLDRLKTMADDYDLVLLPEIHAEYGTGLHEEVAANGFPVYDFFLPGLVIDALDRGTNHYLLQWMRELVEKDLRTVNMLGCHDGIPVLDLRGMLPDEEIDAVIESILERGGRIKNLYGADGRKIAYYQVNATYFSALGEDEQKLRLARAIQMFTPGVPQVWYLDLFAGTNDYAAADHGGAGAHKEINRTTLTLAEIEAGLETAVVQDQLNLMRLRNTSPAFDGEIEIAETPVHLLDLTWRHEGHSATLRADLRDHSFEVTHTDGAQTVTNLTS